MILRRGFESVTTPTGRQVFMALGPLLSSPRACTCNLCPDLVLWRIRHSAVTAPGRLPNTRRSTAIGQHVPRRQGLGRCRFARSICLPRNYRTSDVAVPTHPVFRAMVDADAETPTSQTT